MSDDNTFRVWVGCLACYNAGTLVGKWFDADDAPQDEDEFNERVPEHAKVRDPQDPNPHEEIWCFDTENSPVSGEMDPSTAAQYAEWLEGIDDVDVLKAWLSETGNDFDEDSKDKLEDAYCGTYDNFEEYVDDMYADRELPEWAEPHRGDIIEGIARDLRLEGGYWIHEVSWGVVMVFTA